MIYFSVECLTGCGRCGQPVMVNGPVLRVLCRSCQSELAIDHVTWESVMEHITKMARGLREGAACQMTIGMGQEFNVTVKRTAPACPSCKKEMKAPDTAGSDDAWRCHSCGAVTPALPPPQWLARMAPAISLVVGAQEEEPDGKPEPAAGKPVIFSCPSCGGNLTVDGSDRLVTCTFCRSSIYLPDDLWLRLHPARTVRAWYIGLNDDGWEQERDELNRQLLVAARNNDADAGAEALANGADPGCADDDGRTVLYLAAAMDCRPLVRLLIEKKVEIDRRDCMGTTPLGIAAYNGFLMTVKLLLKEGADVNAKNDEGVTPIYGAARNGHAEVVRLLLKSGADPTIPNEDGVPPAEKAAQEGHREIAEMLRKHKG